jgi:hypothetical protein
LETYPEHLPLVKVGLLHADNEATRSDHLDDVVACADKVAGLIDQVELATHFGTLVDEEDPEALSIRKQYELQKETLVDALARKARAIGEQVCIRAKKASAGSDAGGGSGSGGGGGGGVALGDVGSRSAPPPAASGVGDGAGATAGTKPADADDAAFAEALKQLKRWAKVDHKSQSKLLLEADLRVSCPSALHPPHVTAPSVWPATVSVSHAVAHSSRRSRQHGVSCLVASSVAPSERVFVGVAQLGTSGSCMQPRPRGLAVAKAHIWKVRV